MRPCVRCQRLFPEDVLLFGDDGMICQECQVDALDQVASDKATGLLLLGGPFIGIASGLLAVSSIIPVLGLFFGAMAIFFAALGIAQSTRAFSHREEHPAMLASAVTGLVLSLGAMAVAGLILTLTVVTMLAA